MSAFLPNLERVFGWLLAASWQASVLALVVVAIQGVFGARLNPRWRYALWLLVVLRLLLPVLPESALSLFQFAPPPPAALTVSVTEPLFIAAPVRAPVGDPVAIPPPGHALSIYSLLALIWLAGAVGLLTLTLIVNRRFTQQVASSPEITDPELLRLFAEAKTEFHIRRPIRLIENGQVQSPAIMGLFHPTLLLPVNVRENFDARELRFIFLHELAHLKRGDVLVQALIALLQILHWFNPVLWFAFRRMRIDREPATDALVLSRTGEDEKERYGLMLIKLLEHFNQRHSLATLVGILEEKDQFKRRFSLIARFTRGAYGWSLLGLLLIGILAVAGLTKNKSPSTHDKAVAKADNHPPESNEKKLIAAAQHNEVLEIARLLQLGVDVNAHVGDRDAILKAAESGSVDAVKFLLAHKADPNSTSEPGYNYTPLSLTKKPVIADLLLAAGARINATLFDRSDPIVDQCVTFGPPEMLEWFIAHGVDVKKSQGENPDYTLLFGASSPEIAAILIKHGVDVNARAKDGSTALDHICFYQKAPVEIARALLQHGADPNARDNNGRTPLSYASDSATVDLLVDKGADVKKAGNCFGVTAYAKEEPGRMKALIAHGVPFDVKKDGPPLLEREAWRGHAETVAYLLELGVDPEQENFFGPPGHRYGMTPLEAATTDGGGFEAAKVLVEHGAKIRPKDVNNALYNRRKDIMKLFWDHGARPVSELVYKLSQGDSLADIQKLLDAGAPLDPLQDATASSPLEIAAQLGNLDAVKLLVSRGAKVNEAKSTPSGKRYTESAALLAAASEGQDEVVSYLLANGATPDPTALAQAAENSTPYSDQKAKDHFEKCVRILIDAGALKSATPDDKGMILASAIGTRQGPPNASVVEMVLNAGVRPDSPMPDIVEYGEKPDSVIGYYRSFYAKNKDNPAGYETAQIKPLLDMLEAADKAASIAAVPSLSDYTKWISRYSPDEKETMGKAFDRANAFLLAMDARTYADVPARAMIGPKIDPSTWPSFVDSVHADNGEVQTRKLKSVGREGNLPGADLLHDVSLNYETTFQKGGATKTMIESLSLSRSPRYDPKGEWRVWGFRIIESVPAGHADAPAYVAAATYAAEHGAPNPAVAVMPVALSANLTDSTQTIFSGFHAVTQPGGNVALDTELIDLVRDGRTDKVGKGDADKVMSLLGEGASPSAKDAQGNSALTWALNFGKDDAAQALIKAGADGRAQDLNDENAAWLAAKIYYCPGALELMIKEGVDVRGVNKAGQTILVAMMHVRPAQAGKMNYLNDRVWTADEFKAYEARERRVVELLVAARADFNGKDGTTTPLMAAVQSGHAEVVRALLAHGADKSFKDADGHTAFDLAKMFHPELVPVLEAAGR